MALIPVLIYFAALLPPANSHLEGARPGIDVVKYTFSIGLSDDSNVIQGDALVTVRFTDGPRDFYLDFDSRDGDDTGMTVEAVTEGGAPVSFEHRDDRLWIRAGDRFVDSVATFDVVYSGVPADGLIISNNRYGDRTFFADNWPDRAHYWIPTVDHPIDKALVDFVVTAPDRYQVISNGRIIEQTDIGDGRRRTHWSSSEVLPTKIMVIGVAQFAVQYLGNVSGVPLETWVYPESRKPGFYDFAVAEPALRFFVDLLGPFPFEKLANVQSTTRYGGMENAGAIFYNERSVLGNRLLESSIAHEIAHQWFGDSASEEDWYDVWLSEGFATYCAHLYNEHYYGSARLATGMAADRQKVIAYATSHPASSIVDTTITDPNDVLNTNTYEKASWVLHMLRSSLGDPTFFDAIRAYYEKFRYGNASTADFKEVVESVSGKDLGWFFDQWIFRAGLPQLSVKWHYDPESGEVVLDTEQRQALLYRLPLELAIETAGGQRKPTVEVTSRRQSFRIQVDGPPTLLRVDPDVKLLARLNVD